MIPFRELTLDDREAALPVICASGCHGADYNFANLYIWRHEYEPRIHFMDNRLLLMMPKYGDLCAYPKGDGDVEPLIAALLEDAHERGHRLTMRGLTPKTLEELQLSSYKDAFEITEDRDDADYIYTAEKLRHLSGRHLSSKRNHIKHFEKNGPWHFDPVTADDLGTAQSFVAEFYREKGDPDLEAEAHAIDEMFANYRQLEFMGGMLWQNDVPVAFTAGTLLDPLTFDVQFEKALPGIDGAYTMINREFAEMVCAAHPDLMYFNREEDMGLEGLRKAKESYHPDILLMKYTAAERI